MMRTFAHRHAHARATSSPGRVLSGRGLRRASGQTAEIRHILGRGAVQPKLTVSEPNDALEQEADRVAEEVMRMEAPEPGPTTRTHALAPAVQRACSGCGEATEELVQREADDEEELLQPKRSAGQRGVVPSFPGLARPMEEKDELPQAEEAAGRAAAVTPKLAADIALMRGRGQPLPASERAFFEPRFGSDFSQVRIHTGSRAAASAQAMNARAYTIGQDVVFGAGQSPRETTEGRTLLAHELTHVVQQGRPGPRQAGLIQRRPNDPPDEASTVCTHPSGTDTITFAPHLARTEPAVQLHYRKEDPPDDAVEIYAADLSANLFTPTHPLISILEQESCNEWIRFEVTDKPPGFQGPVLDGTVAVIWGVAPPPRTGGTTTTTMLEEAGTRWQLLVEPFLFDFIVSQRKFARQDESEAFDVQVVDAFFNGLRQGLGEGFGEDLTDLLHTYAQHIVFLPILQHHLWLGALDGLVDQLADTLVFLTHLVEDPERISNEVLDAIRRGIMQPRSTAERFGQAIGQDLKQQVGQLLSGENRESPSSFLYALGKIVGPVLVDVIFAIVAPEAIILRGGIKTAGKLFDFVNEFFEIDNVKHVKWKPFVAETLDDPDALARLGEILRGGSIRLESGHEIRLIGDMLVRCSDRCSILARIYSPVLYNPTLPDATELRDLVAEIQQRLDARLLDEGMTKQKVLGEFNEEITSVGNLIEDVAKGHGIQIPDELKPQVESLLVNDFKENHIAIGSFLSQGQQFVEVVAGQPTKGVKAEFAKLWIQRKDLHENAVEIMQVAADPARTPPAPSHVERALKDLSTAGDEGARRGIIDRLREGAPRLRRPARVVIGVDWNNPRPAFLTAAEFEALPDQDVIDPRQLRLGQTSVSLQFTDPNHGDINDMAQRLANDDMLGLEDPIDIVLHPNGGVYTLDHRRIIAAQAATIANENLRVPYRKRSWERLSPGDQTKIQQLGENAGRSIAIK